VERNRLLIKSWKKCQGPERNKIIHCLSLLSIACLFFIASCGGGSPPPSVPPKGKEPIIARKKVEPIKVAVKKELEKKEETVYSYNPVGKPDPFKPFIQLTSTGIPRTGPLTPLQKYDISQLKLVAIISTHDGNIALVEDSLGKGYFLKKGTLIGKSNGKVTKIFKDKVVIEEDYQDIYGQTKAQEISLFLHRPEEEGES
jgi:type IV pilus assembly protein PilP